jgi:hypothetical protein
MYPFCLLGIETCKHCWYTVEGGVAPGAGASLIAETISCMQNRLNEPEDLWIVPCAVCKVRT